MTESNIKLDFDLIEKSLAKEFQFYSPTYIVGRTIDQINIDRAIDIAVSNFNSYNKEVFYSISKNLGELLDAKICFLDIDDCPCEDMYYTIKHLSSDNELLKSTTIKAIEKDLYIKAPTTEHPIDYSIQVSFKGKEAYTDLRFKISEKAIGGWRFNNLKPNVIKKDIDSLSTAKKLLKNFSLNGNKYFDPLMKPKNIIAEPMDEHDISWLNLGDLEVKSEENKNKEEEESKSFIVTVEKGLLDYGVQLPYFHEYFLAGKNFFGQLRLRSIESDGRDLEGKDSIPAGKSFWIGTFDRNVNPYLLTKRSIEKKAKPLDGTCGIPSSLKKDIPKEYHYWEENDIKKAFEIRKSLVASKLISADSIQYHKELNAFRLVHKKMFLGVDVALLKKDCFTNFELKQQDWLGDDNQAKRSAWFLSFKSLDLPTLELQSMNIEKAIGQELKNNLYFVSGDIEPDTKYNTAKSISSTIRNIDSGNVEFIVKSSDNFSAIFKGLTLEGEYIFTREEPESKYWFITKKNDDIVDEQCSLVEIEEGFVCKNY
ncbi:MAG: hypothetical protein KKC80_08775, partial [Candidatus Margulisbacteria bacterium]|nr:hypothetical protein [Candidatus Margulisiibacteriota bacterium]